jgi:hypothetical protein
MKLQFPFAIGVFVTSFGALGCGVSNSEVPDRQFWNTDASLSDAGIPGSDASSAADGGSANDGSVYGRNDAGSQPQAGAGGSSHQAGSGSAAGSGGDGEPAIDAGVDSGSPLDAGGGGTGGDGEPVAGSGGSAGSSEPIAGSGGSGGNTCPTVYTMATHIQMQVTWPKKSILGVTVVEAGSGTVHIWTKSKFTEDGSTATVVSKSCGSTLPEIVALGNEKLLPEIPNASWEKSSMPSFTGTATKTGDQISASPGTALVGLTMSTSPTATWPARTSIMGVDHDSDSHPGLAAVPKTGGGYSQIPVDISRSKRADRVDLAIRNVMTLSATVSGCPETYTGTASVTKFDNHIIGCHISGGSECSDTQIKFVDDNRTVYAVGSATYKAMRVSDSATCADVRAAVP